MSQLLDNFWTINVNYRKDLVNFSKQLLPLVKNINFVYLDTV